MKGRKVIPIEIKKAKGTRRKHRERSINVDTRKPYPPRRLSKRGKQIFRQLVRRLDEIGLACRTFTEIIAMLAFELEWKEQLEKILEDEGRYYLSGDLTKEHPGVKTLDRLNRHIHALMSECGLTPSAIQKVGVKPKKKDNEFSDF